MFEKKVTVVAVKDKMQSEYSYELIEPIGRNFDSSFKPELSPQEMLSLGIFEGKYMNDCQYEFPQEWFANAKMNERSNEKSNYFKVKSRLSLQEWEKRGWIIYPDVRGWFQWYCRYFIGRRIEKIDSIQIKRWKMFYRHKAQILKNCPSKDFDCRQKQRQALLQWAYNPFF